MRPQLLLYAVRMNLHIIIFDMYAGGSEHGIIERTEGVEILGVYLGGAVAAHQVILEEDTYLRYDRPPVGMPGGGDFDACQQVLLAVRAQYADREL